MSRQEYDVIIIGGGLGGLLSAVILSRKGMKVCVLEKNRQIGGCLQTFALRKKVFDSCVHYIGGLDEGHTLHQIFTYAGIMDALPLLQLDETGFDHIMFGDEEVSYPLATRKHFIASLLPYFPNEEAALKAYLDKIDEVTQQFPLYNLKSTDAGAKTAVFGMELLETLNSLSKNRRLVEVLLGNNMLYAGVGGQTPFYVHALSLDGYLHSTHKAVPGSSQISKLLWRELQRHGGEMHRHSEVMELQEADGLIRSAKTADGQQWHAKQFISAIHPQILFKLTNSRGLRPAFRERVSHLPHTPAGAMINLVLKPGTIAYPGHNIYWHPSGEVLGRQTPGGILWPDTQALFYNEDRTNQGFAESVTILVYADSDVFSEWEHLENITGVQLQRSETYSTRKKAFASDILSKTFLRFPELENAVLEQAVATPLTIRDYTGTPGGSLYGPLKDASRPAQSLLGVRTKIPNLLLTGQNVNMHGVMGVSISAVATCAELLGTESLLSEIRSA